ncbi:MAG: Ferredoxin [Pelotomaculum sp. PtaU1.Bin035]|nr:MAG: Ferredoxin [Pelotomaculum sp. PtaU1.Bin035]
MRVDVDQDLCISCGTCIDICPDVFQWNEENKASSAVDHIPADLEEQAHEAAENCPTEAITDI